jgi:hypothetical protein
MTMFCSSRTPGMRSLPMTRPRKSALYRQIFENLRSISLGPKKSLAYLKEAVTEETPSSE